MEARERLYEVMDRDVPFEEKATLALPSGRRTWAWRTDI